MPCAGKEADRGPPGCMVRKRFVMAPWPQGSGASTPLAPVADGGAGTGSLPGGAGGRDSQKLKEARRTVQVLHVVRDEGSTVGHSHLGPTPVSVA